MVWVVVWQNMINEIQVIDLKLTNNCNFVTED